MPASAKHMPITDRFRITKIVIVESLEAKEVKTGQILSDLLQSLVAEHAPQLRVQYESCDSVVEFKQLILILANEARLGLEAPILHMECHGGSQIGLEFANGSSIAWEDLAQVLSDLNIASSFNLLVVLSACYGGQLLGEVLAFKAAPCWCIVAPSEAINDPDAIGGFRTFYFTLITTRDVGIAASALASTAPSEGYWFTQFSHLWFEQHVIDFIESHCTKSAVRKRAKLLYYRTVKDGHRASVDGIIEKFRREHQQVFTGLYFETFFCTDRIPTSRVVINVK